MENTQLSALARQFVLDDMYQRITKLVDGVMEKMDRKLWFIDLPLTGEVATLSEIPYCGPNYAFTEYCAYYHRWGQTVRWIRMPIHLKTRSGICPDYFRGFATYSTTPVLDNAIWSELQRVSQRPTVPVGHTLETIGRKQDVHERLLSADYHVEIAFYQRSGEAVSIPRQYSQGFIRSFGLPGEGAYRFDTLDAQLQFLQSFDTQSDMIAEIDQKGIQEDRKFLASLKAQCYAIKDKDGRKQAFDIYKTVARYIDGGLTSEESA